MKPAEALVHRFREGHALLIHRKLLILGKMSPRTSGPATHGPRRHKADGSTIRVLVVDDEPTLTDLLSMALRYEGWEVRTAGAGRQALSVAREFRPDAIAVSYTHLRAH